MGNWAGTWFILNAVNEGTLPGGADVIKKKKGAATFKLVPADKAGKATTEKKVHHYTIKFIQGAPSEYWVGARFFPEGNNEPAPANGPIPYPGTSPSSTNRTKFDTLVAAVSPQLLQAAGTKRLRAIIDKNSNPEFLYLYKVANAFVCNTGKKNKNKVVFRDLLIISLHDPTAPAGAYGHESGSGSGGKYYP